jgi:hypothetical protein
LKDADTEDPGVPSSDQTTVSFPLRREGLPMNAGEAFRAIRKKQHAPWGAIVDRIRFSPMRSFAQAALAVQQTGCAKTIVIVRNHRA